MRYRLDPRLVERYPEVLRGIVVARGVDNALPSTELAVQLEAAVEELGGRSLGAAEEARLEAWRDAYRRFGSDPGRHTPSIVFLVDRIRRGKGVRSISPIVDVFNLISLHHVLPAGGDDRSRVEGDLCLGLASGRETFSPLFEPEAEERPEPGEVVYRDEPSGRVLCRRWNWRNAHFSRIRPETEEAVINVDGLSSVVSREEVEAAAHELMELLLRHCQGIAEVHLLDAEHPEVEI